MGTRIDKRFGRYQVVAEIGRGAMGAVYKARDPKIDRFVAIKAISSISQSPEEEQDYRERFVREAQAAGRLLHPGIVAVFDVGEESETRTPYIVMEYVAGQSLSGVLSSSSNKLPLETALLLTEEIAEALECAHTQGVVHRDIKPANILLTENGHAKIADFGIAKLNLSNVTLPGHALGTPAYMSPEQVDGRPVDGRSDLFSLGVIFYSMVTGHRPFQGSSAVTVCYKVANAEPLPATSFDLNLPPEVDALVARAIAKNPDLRYQRGGDFARDIRELRQRLGQARAARTQTTSAQAQETTQPPAQTQPVPGNLRSSRPASAKSAWTEPSVYAAALVLFSAVVLLLFGIPFHSSKKNAAQNLIATDVVRHAKAVEATPAPSPQSADVPSAPVAAVVMAARQASPLPKKIVKVQPKAADEKIPAPPLAQAPAETARLKIEVQHHFADGKISLWVDEKLAYSADLHGQAKRRLAVFHDVQGRDSTELTVPAGQHTLRVSGQSSSHDFDESKTVTTNFVSGAEKVLEVDFEKNNREMRLVLR